LSVPIASAGGTSAAVNLYASTPHAFTSDDLLRARSYARQVALGLQAVVRVAERAEATAGLAVAQSSLVLVDLAVRSLMNEYGLSREGALRFLQREAAHHELDLRDAALNVVVPGPGREPAGAGREEAATDVEDFRLVAPAELDQPPRARPARRKNPSTTAKGRPA
jgi:hypothetical protein